MGSSTVDFKLWLCLTLSLFVVYLGFILCCTSRNREGSWTLQPGTFHHGSGMIFNLDIQTMVFPQHVFNFRKTIVFLTEDMPSDFPSIFFRRAFYFFNVFLNFYLPKKQNNRNRFSPVGWFPSAHNSQDHTRPKGGAWNSGCPMWVAACQDTVTGIVVRNIVPRIKLTL